MDSGLVDEHVMSIDYQNFWWILKIPDIWFLVARPNSFGYQTVDDVLSFLAWTDYKNEKCKEFDD